MGVMDKVQKRLLKWLFAIGCAFILAITVANLDKVAVPREIEQYTATAYQNPEVFARDDLGACFLSSTNDIIPILIARTSAMQKTVIHYSFYALTIFLLFRIAQLLTAGAAAATIVPLVLLYGPWNFLGFHSVVFKVEFTGMVLAGPFLAGCLLFFLKERYGFSGAFAAAAFYFHPGVTLWLFLAIFSFFPVAMIFDRRQSSENFVNRLQIAGRMWLFAAVFIVLAWPRLKVLLMTGHAQTFIDPQFGYDLLHYIWRGQTSLWLDFVFAPDRRVPMLSWLAFIFLLIIHVWSFWKVRDKNVRLVFYMYLGTCIFLVVNEFLINLFDSRIGVVYGLCRSSGFNFLFSTLLMAIVIRDSAARKNYVEFTVWMVFLLMFFMVHALPGAIIHVALLATVVCVRCANGLWGIETNVSNIVDNNSAVFKQSAKVACILLLVGVVGISLVRIPKKIKNITGRKQDLYRQAIEYTNEHNVAGEVVMYPFTKEETYFLYSRSPGFFTSYYVVAFIPLYQFDAEVQQKAFEKFRALEKEFGIDTWAQVRKDPAHYKDAWEAAWASKIDRDFVEHWAKTSNIRYIIRENKLSALPYTVDYQNNEFTVYRR